MKRPFVLASKSRKENDLMIGGTEDMHEKSSLWDWRKLPLEIPEKSQEHQRLRVTAIAGPY